MAPARVSPESAQNNYNSLGFERKYIGQITYPAQPCRICLILILECIRQRSQQKQDIRLPRFWDRGSPRSAPLRCIEQSVGESVKHTWIAERLGSKADQQTTEIDNWSKLRLVSRREDQSFDTVPGNLCDGGQRSSTDIIASTCACVRVSGGLDGGVDVIRLR